MDSKWKVAVGEQEELGQPVKSRLGQAAAVGQNKKGEKELYFVSNGNPATFYVLDLLKGSVKFSRDLAGSNAVWGMAVSPDGNVYFSGTSDGVLYCYVQETMTIEKVAKSPEDPFVWDIQSGGDGTVFSATYPRSKLFAYEIATKKFCDLGRMSEQEQYARGIAATNNFVYVGIGSTIQFIRYNRNTGQKEELPLERYSGEKGFIDRIWVNEGTLFLSVNQEKIIVYDEQLRKIKCEFDSAGAVIPSEKGHRYYYFPFEKGIWKYDVQTATSKCLLQLDCFQRTTKIKLMHWVSITQREFHELMGASSEETENAIRRSILMIVSCYGDVWYYDPLANRAVHKILDIAMKPLLIQSILADENDMLYLGGYHRGLCFYNTKKNEEIAQFPTFPQIEGMTIKGQKVYFGTYTQAEIYMYDKSIPVQSLSEQSLSDSGPEATNPRFVFPIGHEQDRPFTLTSGDGQLFVGTIPDYGLNTGALTVYNRMADQWTVYPDVSPNRSIVGLAYKDGLLYGGTSIWGGLGIDPVEEIAEIFIWDTKEQKVLDRFVPLIPNIDVPPKMIGELSVGPDGNIWGAVDGTLFVMDPKTKEVIRSCKVSDSVYSGKFRPVYLLWGKDGMLYTGLGRKIVVVNPATLDFKIVEEGPVSIIALGSDGHLYYGIGSRLYRRTITQTSS